MTAIAVLFVVGAILLGFEVFLPGGILGVIAVVALLGGCLLAFLGYGLVGGMLAVLIAMVMLGIVLYFEFAILPKTAVGRRLFLFAAVDGQSGVTQECTLEGRTGEAVTDMAPSGYVLIEGKRHEAFSRAGFLDAGTPVKVVGSDNFRLIVIPESPQQS